MLPVLPLHSWPAFSCCADLPPQARQPPFASAASRLVCLLTKKSGIQRRTEESNADHLRSHRQNAESGWGPSVEFPAMISTLPLFRSPDRAGPRSIVRRRPIELQPVCCLQARVAHPDAPETHTQHTQLPLRSHGSGLAPSVATCQPLCVLGPRTIIAKGNFRKPRGVPNTSTLYRCL